MKSFNWHWVIERQELSLSMKLIRVQVSEGHVDVSREGVQRDILPIMKDLQ